MTPPFAPVEAVILAIDPARTSGWAVFDRGRYVTSGTAKTHDDRCGAIEIAKAESTHTGHKLIVVAEKWTAGGAFGGARTMGGLGAQWGKWQAALEASKVPKARVVRVYPQTWRARVLGGGWGVKSDEWARRAKVRAEAVTLRPMTEDDECEAVCIALWALHATEVAAKARKRRSDLGVRRVVKDGG